MWVRREASRAGSEVSGVSEAQPDMGHTGFGWAGCTEDRGDGEPEGGMGMRCEERWRSREVVIVSE